MLQLQVVFVVQIVDDLKRCLFDLIRRVGVGVEELDRIAIVLIF